MQRTSGSAARPAMKRTSGSAARPAAHSTNNGLLRTSVSHRATEQYPDDFVLRSGESISFIGIRVFVCMSYVFVFCLMKNTHPE